MLQRYIYEAKINIIFASEPNIKKLDKNWIVDLKNVCAVRFVSTEQPTESGVAQSMFMGLQNNTYIRAITYLELSREDFCFFSREFKK